MECPLRVICEICNVEYPTALFLHICAVCGRYTCSACTDHLEEFVTISKDLLIDLGAGIKTSLRPLTGDQLLWMEINPEEYSDEMEPLID